MPVSFCNVSNFLFFIVVSSDVQLELIWLKWPNEIRNGFYFSTRLFCMGADSVGDRVDFGQAIGPLLFLGGIRSCHKRPHMINWCS